MCNKFVENLSRIPPLLKIIHKYKDFERNKNYCDIFPESDGISQVDQNELKKFSFINVTKLNAAKGSKINPYSISPFKY